MILPTCVAHIRGTLEQSGQPAHVSATPRASWTVASAELCRLLECAVACASNHEQNSIEYALDDYESLVETLDDLAPLLYRVHITQAHALLLAHSGHYAEADHMLTSLYELLVERLEQADASWSSVIYADIAITHAAKGRVLDWRGDAGTQSLCRYKAALNAVRRSERTEFQEFVHDLYFESTFRAGKVGVAMHVQKIQRGLHQRVPDRHHAILNQRLWRKGLGSEQVSDSQNTITY